MENSNSDATETPAPFYSVFPVPKNNRGQAFHNIEDILSHLQGEATGHYLIGSNGMWHAGIHITDATTPWCALTGRAANEVVDYPVPYEGEQYVRCMADGEVVAYRINRDYLTVPWETGDLSYSASFVLVRHHIQPGRSAASALTFYTLYMHLAPWSAYPAESMAYRVADEQYLNAYVDESLQWTAATLNPGTRVTWNKADPASCMTGTNGRQYARVELVDGVNDRMTLHAGDVVWVVCDNGNLVPDNSGPVRPAWWQPLLPPAKAPMQFDTVVCPEPYPIKAGDAVGHLGYYQAPKDYGYNKRYQVHIECFTTDDLPSFLSNPEGVGRDSPAFGQYPAGIPVYMNDGTGKMRQTNLTTHEEGIFPLAGTRRAKSDGVTYWQTGGTHTLLAQTDMKLLSRHDLAARGFETVEDSSENFDHLDGKNQPQGLVRHLFQTLFNASSKDPRTSHALVKHNYQRLLDKVDTQQGQRYNAEEYRRAVQNPDYAMYLYHQCAKHPSDWYYGSDDPIWQSFLTPQLKKEAPEWYSYTVRMLAATPWMNQVPGMVEKPWHMHPLVFMDAISTPKAKGWAHSPFADLICNAESRNDYTIYNRTYPHPHPTHTEVHSKTSLTSMTLQQVMDAQKRFDMFATGRYQITPPGFNEAVKFLGLDSNALYDEAMQDRIFEEYIIKKKRPAIIAYLEGNGGVEDAAYACALEFASVGVKQGKEISPDPHEYEKNLDGSFSVDKNHHRIHKKRYASADGIGYYNGDKLNKVFIMPDDLIQKLKDSKNEVQ